MPFSFSQVKQQLGEAGEVYNFLNAIRNGGSEMYKREVPVASMENIAEVGAGIMIHKTLQNEFIASLVDRIALAVIRTVSLNNPLKKFKKGQMPQGMTIEEIFVDIVQGKKYDPEDAEKTVFKRAMPNVHTLFHQRNRQDYYESTIQEASLHSAFTSNGKFEQFLSGIIQAIYNSAEVEEYEYMLALIDNYYSKGLFHIVKMDEVVSETSAKEFIKKARSVATKMTLPQGSRNFNSLAVRTNSSMQNLHLFIDSDLLAEVNVDVLASAFNMDKTTFLGNTTVVDGFGSTGLEAVLVDESFFMVYDNLHSMETIRNPKGLYWNYFYHVWQTLSVSRFANAVAFVKGAVAPITQVIIDPAVGNLKAGAELGFKSYIRQTDNAVHTLTWTVEGQNGTVIVDGTTVSSAGLLKLSEAQTGTVLVKATATYTDGAETKSVVGEALINVNTSK